METRLNNSGPIFDRKIVTDNFISVIKNLIPRDFMPAYTFLVLSIKNIMLVGYILDQNHEAVKLKQTFSTVFSLYSFRPVYYTAFVLALIWVIFLFKNRARFMISIIINFLTSFLFLIDLWYLRGFNTLPTLHILKAGGNMSDSLDSFLPLINFADMLFMIDIPILILIFFLKRNLYKSVNRNILFSFFMLFSAVFGVFYIAPQVNSQAVKPLPISSIYNKFNPIVTIRSLSPLGYNIYSSYNYFTEKSTIQLTDSDRERITEWYNKKNERLPENEYKGMFKGKNLLLIQVESLENFVINQKVDGQEITPNLNKMLKNSLYFSHVREQVGGGNSSDCDLMLNASVYPVQLGTTFISNTYTEYNSLPKLLRNSGYYTAAFHPDDGAFWNWKPALTSMGFNVCYDSVAYDTTEKINMGISDKSYFEQIEPMIVKQKQPFYTFVVTLSSHSPFELPDQYKELNLKGELEKSKLGGYLQCIRYTDKYLGLLMEKLEKDGLLSNTLVAVTGDHEGVHKYFPEEIKAMKNPEAWWVNNDKRLPLIIYNKNLHPKEIQTTGGQVDIMPTLLYLMGMEEEKYINTAMGRNLLKTNRSFAVLRDRTVVGDTASEDREQAVSGMELSDIIIRGNYFKK